MLTIPTDHWDICLARANALAEPCMEILTAEAEPQRKGAPVTLSLADVAVKFIYFWVKRCYGLQSSLVDSFASFQGHIE